MCYTNRQPLPLPFIANYLLKVGVQKGVRQTVCKLVECGFLFNKVRKYVDSHSVDSAVGLVGQVTIIHTVNSRSYCYCTLYHRLFCMILLSVCLSVTLWNLATELSLCMAGPVVWNSLPVAVRHADSLHSFKRRLKSHFFSLCFNDWQCNALQVRFRSWRTLNSLYFYFYELCHSRSE